MNTSKPVTGDNIQFSYMDNSQILIGIVQNVEIDYVIKTVMIVNNKSIKKFFDVKNDMLLTNGEIGDKVQFIYDGETLMGTIIEKIYEYLVKCIAEKIGSDKYAVNSEIVRINHDQIEKVLSNEEIKMIIEKTLIKNYDTNHIMLRRFNFLTSPINSNYLFKKLLENNKLTTHLHKIASIHQKIINSNDDSHQLIGSVVGGTFTNKLDKKGIITQNMKQRILEANLIERFYNFLKMVPYPSQEYTLYRYIGSDMTKNNNLIVCPLPFSTSMSFDFVVDWFSDLHKECCMLIIKIPIGYPAVFLSSPLDNDETKNLLNQSQKEVTLPPSILMIHDRYIVDEMTFFICHPLLISHNIFNNHVINAVDNYNDVIYHTLNSVNNNKRKYMDLIKLFG